MLIDQIDQWALECPNRIAHQYRDHRITYRQLKTYSDALALWIYHEFHNEFHESNDRSVALKKGTERLEDAHQEIKPPIIVYGHKENEMLVSFLACVKAGHPYVPIDSSVPLERVRQILEASGATLILSPQLLPEGLKLPNVKILEKINIQEEAGVIPSQVADGLEVRDLSNLLKHYLGRSPEREWQVQEDDVYYIIFTSGSTGIPKGVQITLKALESFVNWVNPAYKPEKMKEVFLNQAPFSFDLSVMDLYMSLSNGGTLWSIDKEEIANSRELFQSFARSGVTFWVSTPSFAELCLMDKSFNETLLPDLKRFLFCGEVLPHDVAAKLLERFPRALVENLYGPTEATVAVTTVTITPEVLEHFNPLPVGKAKPDARILICHSETLDQELAQAKAHAQGESMQRALQPQDGSDKGASREGATNENPFDKNGSNEGCSNDEDSIEDKLGVLRALPYPPQTLPEGERGEIIIAGPNVSVGYLNRPEQTRKAFFTWRDETGKLWLAYRTGDAGVLKDGMLFFLGRLDFQVKLHGYRIELGDIEENLRKIPGVENAVVLPKERRGKADYLHAYLTTTEKVEDEFQASQQLREALQKTLPDYMIPRRFSFLETMPMTPNGKVDRRALGGDPR